MSWEELNGLNGKAPLDVNEESQDIDRIITKVFSTRAGQKVLAFFKHMTIDQPTWYPGEDASHGYAREGQNSIVRDILKRIERTRNK